MPHDKKSQKHYSEEMRFSDATHKVLKALEVLRSTLNHGLCPYPAICICGLPITSCD